VPGLIEQQWQEASKGLAALASDTARVNRLLQASVAPSTRQKYDAYWARWLAYSSSHQLVALPASTNDVVLFLANLAADGSRTNFLSAAAAIAWKHAVAGYEAPTKSPRAVALIAGAKRILAAPTHRMEPFTLHVVKNIAKVCSDSDDFAKHRLSFYVILAFFGTFRFSDVQQLKIKHFSFSDHLTILVPQSKTDQWRKGTEVPLSAFPGEAHCPLLAASRFISELRSFVDCSDECFVLTNVLKLRGATRIARTRISARTLTNQLRAVLRDLGLDQDSFSLHSLRAGGATAAAAAHAPRQLIKMHGRWRSDAVDRYIEVPLEDRLAISRSINS